MILFWINSYLASTGIEKGSEDDTVMNCIIFIFGPLPAECLGNRIPKLLWVTDSKFESHYFLPALWASFAACSASRSAEVRRMIFSASHDGQKARPAR